MEFLLPFIKFGALIVCLFVMHKIMSRRYPTTPKKVLPCKRHTWEHTPEGPGKFVVLKCTICSLVCGPVDEYGRPT